MHKNIRKYLNAKKRENMCIKSNLKLLYCAKKGLKRLKNKKKVLKTNYFFSKNVYLEKRDVNNSLQLLTKDKKKCKIPPRHAPLPYIIIY